MDDDDLLLQGDDGAGVTADNLDEDLLLGEGKSMNGDAASVAGSVCKLESIDHEELDYEEDEEKEERESKFTSERSKKSPVQAPEDPSAPVKTNENAGVAGRGSYRGGSTAARGMRGSYRGGNMNGRGGMRMGAGGGSAGPISLLTSNIPPPMMMGGKILVNPNFPNVGAGLTLLPTPGGYGMPPMGGPLRGPMMPQQMQPQQQQMGGPPTVTLSIDGAPALPVGPAVNVVPRPQVPPHMSARVGQMLMPNGLGGMGLPPGALGGAPGGLPMMMGQMGVGGAQPPSAMRFPPGMGPPPMTMTSMGMNMPPPMGAAVAGLAGLAGMGGVVPGAGGPANSWNMMVEAFLGDKKNSGGGGGGGGGKKKKRRRSRSSSYSDSYSDSESSDSASSRSRSRSRSRSPRRSRKRDSRKASHRKHKERSGGKSDRGGGGADRRVFRTGPNSFRINPVMGGGGEIPSLLDGMERVERGGGGGGRDAGRSRRADRERQREYDSRDSARALGLDDDYLSRVEEQRRQREELRRGRRGGERDGGYRESRPAAAAASRSGRVDSDRGDRGRGGGDRDGGRGGDSRGGGRKEEPASDESKRKAYLAVHVKNLSSLGEAALGRVKALAADVGETKKVWRSADDIVTVIFVELDKAKAFMLKYNGKVLSGLRITVGLEKVYLNLSDVNDR